MSIIACLYLVCFGAVFLPASSNAQSIIVTGGSTVVWSGKYLSFVTDKANVTAVSARPIIIEIKNYATSINGQMVHNDVRTLSPNVEYRIMADGSKWRTNLPVGRVMTQEEATDFQALLVKLEAAQRLRDDTRRAADELRETKHREADDAKDAERRVADDIRAAADRDKEAAYAAADRERESAYAAAEGMDRPGRAEARDAARVTWDRKRDEATRARDAARDKAEQIKADAARKRDNAKEAADRERETARDAAVKQWETTSNSLLGTNVMFHAP